MCMYGGGDPPRAWSESYPIARKEHKCEECGRTILKGEPYFRYKGISADGDCYGGSQCEHCHVLACWLGQQCEGWICGGVIEDIEEHARDYNRPDLAGLAECARLKWVAFGRGMSVPTDPPPLRLGDAA